MIQVIDLHKSFGNNKVLDGTNLEIQTGETMVVIGGSGVGKSVLIKNIIGLLKPDQGKVLVDGVEVASLKNQELDRLRRKFGMLFQYSALFDSLTVGENVGFPIEQHTNWKKSEIRDMVKQKLEMVGLPGVEDMMPSELSGGMKKRVGLARAISMEPEILLYDEPTTGLDPIRADVINNLILEMAHKLKCTSVVITHDMVSANKIADRIAMLYNGKIVEVGTPNQIMFSDNPVVENFVEIGRIIRKTQDTTSGSTS